MCVILSSPLCPMNEQSGTFLGFEPTTLASARPCESHCKYNEPTFLQQLIEQQHNKSGHKQLDDDQQTHSCSDLTRLPVHPSHDVHDGLTHCYHHTEYWNNNIIIFLYTWKGRSCLFIFKGYKTPLIVL